MIHIDIHERKIKSFGLDIPRILKKMGTPFEKKLLDVGDYVIIGPEVSACVESKTAGDYMSSIQSGLLNNELLNISSNYDYGILLIHGSPTEAMLHRDMKRRTWFEFLAGCAVETSPLGKQGRISVIHIENAFDAAYFLRTLHKKITTNDYTREPTAQKVRIPPEKQVLYTTRWLFPPDCHIGIKRAKQLLEKFDTIQTLANATEDQIQEIDGFGETLSKRIVEHLSTRYNNEQL